MSTSPTKKRQVRDFIRRKIVEDKDITDDAILATWNAMNRGHELLPSTIRRERTLLSKDGEYDQSQGLAEFFSSQADLLLTQYENIEQLLGPSASDWAWPGEHCETLLRDAIQRVLPPSLKVAKGYIHGVRKTANGPTRSPEVDILIYDAQHFAPLFSMGQFVIVRPESVRSVIQVKRTLAAQPLASAIDNVVTSKTHIRDTCRFNASVITQQTFSAVISFEEDVQAEGAVELSRSYHTALKAHVSDFQHGFLVPDFIGSLTGTFLHFLGINVNAMEYIAFDSVQDDRNVALPFFLYMLVKKIRA